MRNFSRALLLLLPAGLIWIVLNAIGVISFSPCPFHLITGLPCPSCGTTRSILALFDGDPVRALFINPIGPLLTMLLAAAIGLFIRERITGKHILIPFTEKCVVLLQRPLVYLPLIGLVLANWIWNISKGL